MNNYQKKQKGNATLSTIVIAASALLIGSYVANNMDSIAGKSINKLHAATTNSNPFDLISQANTLLANNNTSLSDLYALQSKLNNSPYTSTLNNLTQSNAVNNAINMLEADTETFIDQTKLSIFDFYLPENQIKYGYDEDDANNAIAYLDKTESDNYIETIDGFTNDFGNNNVVAEKDWLNYQDDNHPSTSSTNAGHLSYSAKWWEEDRTSVAQSNLRQFFLYTIIGTELKQSFSFLEDRKKEVKKVILYYLKHVRGWKLDRQSQTDYLKEAEQYIDMYITD